MPIVERTREEQAARILAPLRTACEARIVLQEAIADIERILAGDLAPEPVRVRTEELVAQWIDDYAMDSETAEGLDEADAMGVLELIAERDGELSEDL